LQKIAAFLTCFCLVFFQFLNRIFHSVFQIIYKKFKNAQSQLLCQNFLYRKNFKISPFEILLSVKKD